MKVYFDFDDINDFGDRIESLEELYRKLAEKEIFKLLKDSDNREITLKKLIVVDCWNRGYSFVVKKLKLRKDDSVMIVGDYAGKNDVTEFFSYICNFKHVKQIIEEVLP
jgi:hypothetical protein